MTTLIASALTLILAGTGTVATPTPSDASGHQFAVFGFHVSDATKAKLGASTDVLPIMEERLKSLAINQLSDIGWKVMTPETTLEVLKEKGFNPDTADNDSCLLAVAKDMGLDFFLSGTLYWSDGFVGTLRLINVHTATTLFNEDIEASEAQNVRSAFEEKAGILFEKFKNSQAAALAAMAAQAAPPPAAAAPPPASTPAAQQTAQPQQQYAQQPQQQYAQPQQQYAQPQQAYAQQPQVVGTAAVPQGEEIPPPAAIPPPAIAPGSFPPGQWVMTEQYGNVWMPYDSTFTHEPLYADQDPQMFLYTAAYGWRWLPAPWIYGIGPQPTFGVYGYARFGWYGRGYYGHPWYGYREGYPPGYRGVYVTHPGAYYGGRGYVAHNAGGYGGRPVVHEEGRPGMGQPMGHPGMGQPMMHNEPQQFHPSEGQHPQQNSFSGRPNTQQAHPQQQQPARRPPNYKEEKK